MTSPHAVVIGVGNDYRRDDGIGPAAARELEKYALPGVLIAVCDGDPAGLLQAWDGADLAVVIDAIRCEPGTPGRIRRTTVDALCATTTATSSHALGVPDAFRLGRVLGRLPRELVVIAVEAARLDLGAGLSEPVAAALPLVVDAVRAELAHVGVTTDRTTAASVSHVGGSQDRVPRTP